MRCSECGKPIKPVVAVDIDGTLGNYHDHFVRFAEMYLGRALPTSYGGDVEFSDYLGLQKHVYLEVKLAYRQGGMKRSMPVYLGAPRFMHLLKEDGYEIWIATTRPWMRLDNIDPDTRHWLKRNSIPWDYMIYGDDKWHQLLERVEEERIVGAIDDDRDSLFQAWDLGILGWQPERFHNRNARIMEGLTFADFHTMRRVLKEVTDEGSDHGRKQRHRSGDHPSVLHDTVLQPGREGAGQPSSE